MNGGRKKENGEEMTLKCRSSATHMLADFWKLIVLTS